MQIYIHPTSGARIFAERLKPGARVRPTDRFNSTHGRWESAGDQIAGTTVPEGDHVIWVREPNWGFDEMGVSH